MSKKSSKLWVCSFNPNAKLISSYSTLFLPLDGIWINLELLEDHKDIFDLGIATLCSSVHAMYPSVPGSYLTAGPPPPINKEYLSVFALNLFLSSTKLKEQV